MERSGVVKVNGERVRYFAKVSFNQIYYSFDHELTWHRTKSAAYDAAQVSGLLAVIGRAVQMPNGLIATAF